MKQSIKTRKDGFHIDIGQYTLSIGCGSGHYCANHMRPFNSDNEYTDTMEVALMKGDEFVVLDQDVAGYIPCGTLARLIVAVEREDWQMFAELCNADMAEAHGI